MQQDVVVIERGSEHDAWVEGLLTDRWGSASVVSKGLLRNALTLPGFIAIRDNQPLGLVTYDIADNACEVVTLDSLVGRQGVGTALLDAVGRIARDRACARLWLITTNDNLDAIAFYERRGWIIAAVHPGAIDVSRRLKPGIPLVGKNGIPITDEIEFELALDY